MNDKALTVDRALEIFHEASEKIYATYPGTTENRIALSEAILTQLVSGFLSDILEQTDEDARVVLQATILVKKLLHEIKDEIVEKKRNSTGWSN